MKFIFVGATLILSVLSNVHNVMAQSPDEVAIGPVEYNQNVNGVNVAISSTSYVKLITTDNKIYIHARVVGDLIDLQRKIGQIVDTFKLPSENCRSFSPKNPVVSIPRKELRATGSGALFSVGGTVVMWQCLENPAIITLT